MIHAIIKFLQIRLFFFILYFGIISSSCFGNDEIHVFSKKYDVRNGLASNNLLGAVLDGDDMIWMYSEYAVTFFDGTNVINYTIDNKLYNIASKTVKKISYYDGYIYVSGDGGINRINCKTKSSTLFFKDTKGINIKHTFVSKSGKVLAGTNNGDIYIFEKGEIKYLFSLRANGNYTMIDRGNEKVLISSSTEEIIELDLSTFQTVKYSLPKGDYCIDVLHDPELGFIVLGLAFIYEFPKKGNAMVIKTFLTKIPRMLFITDKYIYTVSDFNFFSRVDKITGNEQVINIDRIENAFVNAILPTKKGNIILATTQGLLVFNVPVRQMKILPLVNNKGKELNHTRRSLAETDNGNIIQVTYKSISIYDPITSINEVLYIDEDLIGYSSLISHDTLWIGADGPGLAWFDLKKKVLHRTSLFPAKFEDQTIHITALCKLSTDKFLAGLYSRPTIILYDIKKDSYIEKQLIFKGKEINKQKISSIYQDQNKRIWLCSDKGLIQLDTNLNVVNLFDNSILPSSEINHIMPLYGNLFWLATNSGICLFDAFAKKVIKQYNKKSGLAGDKCVSVLIDNYNTLWVSTYTGLSRVDPLRGSIKNYFQEDGLADNEYNYSAYLKSKAGTLYFGGLNGYISIDPFPFEYENSLMGKINLTNVLFWDRDEPLKLMELNNNELSFYKNDLIDIRFAVSDLITNEYVKYQYKIDGLHKDWINLDKSNVVRLNGIQPGNYRLQISAILAGGLQTKENLEIILKVSERWYESSLFYLLISVILPLMVLGLIFQGMRAKRDQVAIRTSLTNDIHDEVGTLLTKAAMQAELIRSKDKKFNAELLQIEKNIRLAVNSFRNILWVFNASQESVGNLVERINSNLNFVFQNTNFSYIVINKSSKEYFITDNIIKRNIIYIIRELAHNTLKHSNGDFFEVIISNQKKHWKISVRDNGVNDPDKINIEGIGMQSIRERVSRIKGNVQFNINEKGFQTEINF